MFDLEVCQGVDRVEEVAQVLLQAVSVQSVCWTVSPLSVVWLSTTHLTHTLLLYPHVYTGSPGPLTTCRCILRLPT